MRKFLSMFAIVALCGLAFVSCSDDDDMTPPPTPVTVTDGVFVVNAGTIGNIPGSLTYIGSDGSVTQKAFANANNGMSLGDTPNDAVVNGSKLYIVVNGDNIIWVLDKNTLKIDRQLSTTELMGEDKGKQPRHLLASGQYVFVSTYDGYVAAIDTTTYEATVYQAGSYPEGMAISNGSLYVANSDYSLGQKPSISVINLNSGTTTDIKDELITNPQSFAVMSDAIYFLDYGSYDASYNQTGAGIRKVVNGEITKVADATLMAANTNNGKIYIINAPYSYPATPVTYSVYDTTTGKTTQFITGDNIDSPAAIAVDPVNGDVYITSYVVDPDTGYAGYSIDGYVNRYTADGTFVSRNDVGVGPITITFNYNTVYE